MNAPQENRRWTRKRSVTAANLLLLLFFGTALYLFGPREMRFFLVPTASMEPTLLTGDWVMTLNEKRYSRGDIVVLWDADNNEYITKRVAGLPGDEINIMGGALFIDGHYASEPYLAEPMEFETPAAYRVPEGLVFLLGDNRNNSEDSATHMRGYSMDQLIGRVRFVYYPYDRMGKVYSYPLTNLMDRSERP